MRLNSNTNSSSSNDSTLNLNDDSSKTKIEIKSATIIGNNNEKLTEFEQNNESSLLDSNVKHQNFSPLLRQTLAALGPLLATVVSGLTSGYSAILLPQLQSINSTIPITNDQASWIASMAALPMALGCLLAGVLMERYGRKSTQIFLCVCHIFGWFILTFAMNYTTLLIGRFITGISVGLLGPPGSVYIAETTAPKYRGFFLAGISFSISVGILMAHLLGTFYSWQITAFICGIVPIVTILLFLIVPESPNYLASKGRLKDAEASFRWLRGNDSVALEELEGLLNKYRKLYKEKGQIVSTNNNGPNQNVSFWHKFTKSYFLKPLLIMNAFFAITQGSGVNAVAFYSVSIIQDTLGNEFNSYLAMAIIDITRLILSVIACILLRKYTRRILAVTSTAATALVLAFLAIFVYFINVKEIPGTEYVPLIALISYICAISTGLVPLPWVMIGEVFPSEVRSTGTGLCSCMCFIYFFIVVKTGPFLFSNGPAFAYGIYGLISAIGTIILYLYLPETKDKTLEEIEAYFVK